MSAAGFLDALARRLRRRDRLWIASAALASGALSATLGPVVGLVIAVMVVAAGLWVRRGVWTSAATAALAEGAVPGCDNLLVTATATENLAGLSPAIRHEVMRQADLRAAVVSPSALVPLRRPISSLVVAAALVAGAAHWAPRAPAGDAPAAAGGVIGSAATFDVAVTVTAPAYLRAAPVTLDNPAEVRVPAGGSLRLVVRTGLAMRAGLVSVSLDDAGGAAVALTPGADAGTFERTWSPTQSTTGALVGRGTDGTAAESRLLAIAVVPDERPLVRVARPGRDVRLATADASLEIEVEATDDHGVSALELYYLRMSGGGESFTFAEGRVPIAAVTTLAPSGLVTRGRLSWALGALDLEDGESLVYRVLATDAAPGAAPGESETYTIDVGRLFETEGAGAAVAEEDRRYAISQQMVIVHTERALAERGRVAPEPWLARLQGIAAEQRMVRAEVVFLSGGDVQDEVDEAAHGDELQEGRLENRGRVEMLRAMSEMSRAEARLIAGDARAALDFERTALAALLKAFDRRRYFLRTVPERSRIDQTRRLTGDRRTAAPALRVLAPRDDRLAAERALLLDLAAANSSAPVVATLAARVAGLAPADPQWPQLAAALLAAPAAADRRAALRHVADALRERVRGRLAPVSPAGTGSRDLLDSLWAEERRSPGRPR